MNPKILSARLEEDPDRCPRCRRADRRSERLGGQVGAEDRPCCCFYCCYVPDDNDSPCDDCPWLTAGLQGGDSFLERLDRAGVEVDSEAAQPADDEADEKP